ncbi:type II restriction endonuclease [Fervidobacterium pennivorans subsp. shakshaketiis]|uniref:type II restriction endonuclease n=1 Tax=Fervidobacterium pennivorans TaxID=93466 RepID=UPI00355B81A9
MKIFLDTLLETNKTYDFFVDWKKVRSFVEKNKVEINILNSLLHSEDFDNELRRILRRYPEVLKVVPLLLAIRDNSVSIISEFGLEKTKVIKLDFTERNLREEEIETFVDFFKKTGLRDLFLNIADKSLFDYILGVEVGTDTNARKNRSGKVLEDFLKPIVETVANKCGYSLFVQKEFSNLEKYKVNITKLKNRKADFILLKRRSDGSCRVVNIEVNFYNVSGSKPQEIIDSYIERQKELKEYGYEFLLVTDGPAWKKQKSQLTKALENLDFVLNTYLVRLGILEEVICMI